jgi:hypothetical protein
MRSALRPEFGATAQASTLGRWDPILPAAMRIERGGAVGTRDPQVFESIVIRHAIDVIEDERHASASPVLILAAELAATGLEPSRKRVAS